MPVAVVNTEGDISYFSPSHVVGRLVMNGATLEDAERRATAVITAIQSSNVRAVSTDVIRRVVDELSNDFDGFSVESAIAYIRQQEPDLPTIVLWEPNTDTEVLYDTSPSASESEKVNPGPHGGFMPPKAKHEAGKGVEEEHTNPPDSDKLPRKTVTWKFKDGVFTGSTVVIEHTTGSKTTWEYDKDGEPKGCKVKGKPKEKKQPPDKYPKIKEWWEEEYEYENGKLKLKRKWHVSEHTEENGTKHTYKEPIKIEPM